MLYLCSVKTIVQYIAERLSAVYDTDEARALAWWVVEEMTERSRSQLLCDCKDTTNFSNLQIDDPKMQQIITRLLHFEPIQYIFGHTEWMGLDLLVTPATLIPRPETAELVEKITNYQFPISNIPVQIVDIGTGSGCIAIALKKRHPEWQVAGIDVSAEAIEVARQNARRNNVEVDFRVADIFDSNGEMFHSFNIVVSNPPYICEREKSSMRPNVLQFEPHSALFVPDDDPLCFYRRIASLFYQQSPVYLFFEINEAYSAELSSMLAGVGYTDIQIHNDIYGKPRIIQGRMA